MGNPFPAFYEGMRSAITAAWPGVAGNEHPIYRESQVRRVAWRKLVEARRLGSPWVVISVSSALQSSDFGLASVVYAPRVEIFYITEAVPGEKDMAGFIEGELAALVDVLHPWTQGFQFGGGASFDTSPQNPAQAAFLDENLPLFAGSVSFSARFASSEGAALPVIFDPKYLSVVEIAGLTVTASPTAPFAQAMPDPLQTFDMLLSVDSIAYSASNGLVDFSPADGKIRDMRQEKEDFTLVIGAIDGDGRASTLADVWHLRFPGVRFSLRAKNLDGSDGKWLVLYGVPETLRNGVIYGKNATLLTLRPTFGVLPQWADTVTI